MTQTAEERKIKKLEKTVTDYKVTTESLKQQIRNLESKLENERSWRISFQKLMKEVVHEDTLDPYSKDYY